MKYLKTLIFILSLQSVLASAADFKDSDCSHRWWMNLGLGVGATGDSTGPAGHLSFNGMITENLFLTFERTGTSHNSDIDSNDSTRDAGILLGYKSKKQNWYWSGAAGIAYTVKYKDVYTYNSWSNGGWSSSSYTTKDDGVGLPLEAQLFWTPVKHFGIGLIGHGVVSNNSYAVAMLGIQIS